MAFQKESTGIGVNAYHGWMSISRLAQDSSSESFRFLHAEVCVMVPFAWVNLFGVSTGGAKCRVENGIW